MSYPVDKKAQIHSELALLTPRLACFAAALTGSEPASRSLIRATRNKAIARASRDRGHTPLVLWVFGLMHSLWASRMKGQHDKFTPADPTLFQPRGNTAGAGRMAKFIAQLPPQQRGTLHLVYGERLSYDEVAEIFAVPVATIMTRLARAHAALVERQDAQTIPSAPRLAEDGMRDREWAAA